MYASIILVTIILVFLLRQIFAQKDWRHKRIKLLLKYIENRISETEHFIHSSIEERDGLFLMFHSKSKKEEISKMIRQILHDVGFQFWIERLDQEFSIRRFEEAYNIKIHSDQNVFFVTID